MAEPSSISTCQFYLIVPIKTCWEGKLQAFILHGENAQELRNRQLTDYQNRTEAHAKPFNNQGNFVFLLQRAPKSFDQYYKALGVNSSKVATKRQTSLPGLELPATIKPHSPKTDNARNIVGCKTNILLAQRKNQPFIDHGSRDFTALPTQDILKRVVPLRYCLTGVHGATKMHILLASSGRKSYTCDFVILPWLKSAIQYISRELFCPLQISIRYALLLQFRLEYSKSRYNLHSQC